MIARFNGNVVPFADDATSTNRTVFGGTTQSDLIDDNLNTNFKKGWEIVGLNDNPTREDFNAMGYTLGALISYLYEMGISEWNTSQNYRANSRVIGSDGIIYKAKIGTNISPNVNNNPTTDTTNWEIDNQFYINSLASKATPFDTDNFGIQETGGLFKKTSWANIKACLNSLYVGLAGNQTIAGIKTFSSNIVGNITGNSGTATKLSTTRTNYKDTTDSVVVGELMWKAYGNGHTIFDASNSTSPNGIAIDAVNSGVPWTTGRPTLMGFNGIGTFGVRVDSARVSDYATAFTTAVGSAPSYACRAWVNFNGTGTVAIRASGNVSSITDNGVGDYTVNFTTAMPDKDYCSISSVGYTATTSGNARTSYEIGIRTTSAIRYRTSYTDPISDSSMDPDYVNVSIFR